MLSAKSSLISTNWPDLTLSTSLRGNGSAAGDSTRPELRAGCDSCDNVGGGSIEVLFPTIPDWCWASVVKGVVAWLPVARDTDVRRCGGGRVPKGAGGVSMQ